MLVGFGRKDFKLDWSSFPVTANQPQTQRLWTFSPRLRKSSCLWAGRLTFSCCTLCLYSSWQVWMGLTVRTRSRASLTNRVFTQQKRHYRGKWTVATKPTMHWKTLLVVQSVHSSSMSLSRSVSFVSSYYCHTRLPVCAFLIQQKHIAFNQKHTKAPELSTVYAERSNWCDFFLS